MTDRRARTTLLMLAAVATALGLLLVPLAGATPAMTLGAVTLVTILLALRLERPAQGASRELLTRATLQAESGRKLVIYERETGLFAHWYVVLRCEEECRRALRYERPLTLLLVEPATEDGAWAINERVLEWLRGQLRATDLPGYLGNARYVVIMPETSSTRAKRVAKRLRADIEGSEAALSCLGDDGTTYEELFEAARGKLTDARQVA